jgi:hypothetical protein
MKTCILCGEPVTPLDAMVRYAQGPVHWECGLRSVVGGINHQNGLCSCCGGTLPPDPEGVSKREAARMAAQMWIARNPH